MLAGRFIEFKVIEFKIFSRLDLILKHFAQFWNSFLDSEKFFSILIFFFLDFIIFFLTLKYFSGFQFFFSILKVFSRFWKFFLDFESFFLDGGYRPPWKGIPNNKSPGDDGLTKEFYEIFWDELKDSFINSMKLV